MNTIKISELKRADYNPRIMPDSEMDALKTSIKTFAVETGLDNFFSEKVSMNCEFDTATQRMIDCVLVNTKALYI